VGSLLGWIAAGVPIIMAENHERAGRYVSRLLFTAARRRWRELRTLAATIGGTAETQVGHKAIAVGRDSSPSCAGRPRHRPRATARNSVERRAAACPAGRQAEPDGPRAGARPGDAHQAGDDRQHGTGRKLPGDDRHQAPPIDTARGESRQGSTGGQPSSSCQ
jgi:hypothetical protein